MMSIVVLMIITIIAITGEAADLQTNIDSIEGEYRWYLPTYCINFLMSLIVRIYFLLLPIHIVTVIAYENKSYNF